MIKYNILHNFISPITGRISVEPGFVIIGDDNGMSYSSPALIDIELDLNQLRLRHNILASADFIMGFPNKEAPDAQVLSRLENGFMVNTAGIVSTTDEITGGSVALPYGQVFVGDITNHAAPSQIISIDNLPGLGTSSNPLYLNRGQIWRGTIEGRPVPSDDLTSAELAIELIKLDILGVKGNILIIEGDITFLNTAVAVLQGEVAGLLVFQTATIADLAVLHHKVDNINLIGFVIGGPPDADGTIDTIRGFTDLDMLGFRVNNLQPNPEEDFDAVNINWLWDLAHDEVGIIWP